MSLRRGQVVRFLIVAVCLIWLAWIVKSLGPRRIASIARQADPLLLAVSFVPIAARFLIWSVKWNLMLRRRGAVRWRHTLTALLAGNFVNLTTPTAKLAGGFVRAALVRRRMGWGMAEAYGWSLADQVTNVLGNLSLCGLLALGAGLSLADPGLRVRFVGSGAVALAVALTVVALRGWAWTQVQRPALARWLGRMTPKRFQVDKAGGPAAGWVGPVFRPLLNEGVTWRIAPVDLGLAACSFGSLCVANAVVLLGLGAEAPMLPVAVAVVIGYFAGTVIGTLGGIGVTEVALIKLYTAAGVSPETAAAGALLHRASYYLVITLMGGSALWWEGRQKTRVPEAPASQYSDGNRP